MTGPFGDTAKQYKQNGFHGVLPLPAGEKEAPPTGFTGHGAKYPTASRLANWLRNRSDGNIALRLAEVPDEALSEREDLPVIYGGNNIDGWELIGIDVDDYGDKNGGEQLAELTKELGELPATATSSSRWTGDDSEICSGVRVFLVPKGFKYKGKAAKHIDILYRGLRYMATYPSIHPEGRRYEWRYGPTRSDECPGEDADTTAKVFWGKIHGLPNVKSDIAVLPVQWFLELLTGTESSWDSTDVDLGNQGALVDWASETFRDVEAEPCGMMARDVAKYIANLDDSDSHHPLNNALWRLTLNGIEGHKGWKTAVLKYADAWLESVAGKRDPNGAAAEISRSFVGALAKARSIFDGERRGVLPHDVCGPSVNGDASSDRDGRAAAWADRFGGDSGPSGGGEPGTKAHGGGEAAPGSAEAAARVAAGDYGGLGPVVGRLSTYSDKPANEYDRNDRGNGEHFIDLYDEDVKYVDSRKSWVLWDGERWHRDFGDKLIGLAFKRVEQRQKLFAHEVLMADPDDKQNKAIAKMWNAWALRSGNASQIKNALLMAQGMYASATRVAMSGNEFDSNPALLGCTNGILDLGAIGRGEGDGDVLRDPHKHDYVTYNTGTDYVPWRDLVNADPESETYVGWELWMEYLNKFLPDKRLQNFVQKVLGHMLIGGNTEKLLVFLFGEHDTGKSTMLGAIAGALGDYYGTISMKLFKEQDLNPGLVRAVPLRVAAMSEVDAGTMDAATIKRLTGNDRVTAELKYSNEIFEGTPQFTTVIACNNPPNIKNADEALMERLLVLPFSQSLPRAERKYERQKEIEYHSGVAVLSWLVEGWRKYCETGLKREGWPAAVRKMNGSFGAGLNSTQMFVRENLLKAKNSEDGRRALANAKRRAASKNRNHFGPADLPIEWTPSATSVYVIYQKWCNNNGVQPISQLELTRDIGVGRTEQRKIDGKNVRCYVGLKILEQPEQTGPRLK